MSNTLIYIGVYVESSGLCLALPPTIFLHIRNANH